MKPTPLLLLLLAPSAFASGLDDMKNALAALQGQGAVRGVYEAREQRTEMDGKTVKTNDSAAASALVEDDANGFQMRWDRALLKKAADEGKASANGSKKSEPLTALIGSSSATEVANTVNYAPKLLQLLSICQLKAERADSWQGKPARLLELSFVPPDSSDGKVKIKENSHLAQIWLGADGVPLAASVKHSIKASAMVFLSFEHSSKEDFTFSVVANRLVVLKRDEQGADNGMGSESQFRKSYTFTPKT